MAHGAYTNQAAPQVPAPRNVVELQDALDAVMQLAAVIDEHAQAGNIPADRAKHAAAMLMVIRDYIQPLPVGGDESHDQVAPDLAEIVDSLREVGPGRG
jgi:hypothetical protein